MEGSDQVWKLQGRCNLKASRPCKGKGWEGIVNTNTGWLNAAADEESVFLLQQQRRQRQRSVQLSEHMQNLFPAFVWVSLWVSLSMPCVYVSYPMSMSHSTVAPLTFFTEIAGFKTSSRSYLYKYGVPRHPPRRRDRWTDLCTREFVWVLFSSSILPCVEQP